MKREGRPEGVRFVLRGMCGVEKRWPGQRESRVSVVWWKKAMAGSKGKPWECGLVGKSDGWVKGKAAGVWSGGEKRWLGQREMRWSVVWQEKAPPESKGKPLECGLASKTAAWVKETPPRKVINKKMKENERT